MAKNRELLECTKDIVADVRGTVVALIVLLAGVLRDLGETEKRCELALESERAEVKQGRVRREPAGAVPPKL
jgi:hypothetical protein